MRLNKTALHISIGLSQGQSRNGASAILIHKRFSFRDLL